ncbi:unnamed protein product [Paramecium sonneborni]|uniref:Uncharacterized protein n=1 Tax=Paramecium sonneborni TaxID=65129 RepID=A0A8S1NCA9_9CILI|nr:unnamed protein product [Paramecium sonneborni]
MEICGQFCKLHPQERLTTAHINLQVKRRYKFAQEYKRFNRFVQDPHIEITKDITKQMWGMSKELGKLLLMVAKKYGFVRNIKGQQSFSLDSIKKRNFPDQQFRNEEQNAQ